jgi:hypothetical protein
MDPARRGIIAKPVPEVVEPALLLRLGRARYANGGQGWNRKR